MSFNAQILRTPGGSCSDEENMAAVLAALTDMLNRGGAFAGGHQLCPGHAKGWEEMRHVQRISCSYASSLPVAEQDFNTMTPSNVSRSSKRCLPSSLACFATQAESS
jgi:hypothetical protein